MHSFFAKVSGVSAIRLALLSLFAGSLLAACGGGGGGDDTGNPPGGTTNPLRLVVGVASVSTEGSSTGATTTRTIPFSLQNYSAGDPVHIGASFTNSAIQTVEHSVNGASGTLTIHFKAASTLTPGAYTDTVNLLACRESPCVNHLPGSPHAIAVSHSVPTQTTPPPPPPPPPPPQVTLVLSQTSLQADATIFGAAPTRTVGITLNNLGEQGVYVGGSYSSNGILVPSLSQTGPTSLTLTIPFKDPTTLGAGTYTDAVTVRACLESPCATHIAGSPQVILITYTVRALPEPPTMTLQQNSVSWNGWLMDPMAPPTQQVNVGFTSVPAGIAPFVSISRSSNGLSAASYYPTGNGSTAAGRVELQLKPAPSVGAGTFTDTVVVRACLDAACVYELAGSPANIPVQYTVSDVDTGSGYTARALLVKANDIAWDENRQVIYVAIAPDAPDHANTIGVLDPGTGTFLSYAPVGNDPRKLELSADGQYLYVGLRGASEIQRLSLPSLALDLTIPLGAIGGQQLYGWEFHHSPDSPHILAVVRADSSNNARDLVVFDDDVRRPLGLSQSLAAEKVSSFQWDDGTRIFGFYGPDGAASHIAVDQDGLQMTARQQVADGTDRAVYLFSGRMYTQLGRVYNALDFTAVGTFPLALGVGDTSVLALDPNLQKAFFLTPGTIKVFDANSRAAKGSIPVAHAAPNPFSARMIRWGQDGLALLNYQGNLNGAKGILLIDGTFVTE